MRINIPIIFLLVIASLTCLGVASVGLNRKAKGSIAFAIMMLACGLWSMLFAIELSFTYMPIAIWAAKFTYLSLTGVPVAWLIFALDYEESQTWVNSRRWLRPLLLVVPAITVGLALTNELHQLIWTSIIPIDNQQLILLSPKFGNWFWIHAAYSYSLLAMGTFVLVRQFIRSHYQYRWQLTFMLLSAFLPWIANAIFLAKLSPIRDFDFSSLTFTLSGLLLAWNLFRYRFLGVVPIARQLVLDSIAEAVAVLDLQNRIIDINAAGLKFLGKSFDDVFGRRLIEVSPESAAALIARYDKMLYAQDELALQPANTGLTDEASMRDYELFMSPIQDRRSQIVGRLVILRDITERKRAEQQMQALNADLELRVVERTAELAEINQLLAEERELLSLRVAERTAELQTANAKLATAARLKDQFLATISHELRTPLNAILGTAKSLQSNVYGSLHPAQSQALQTLQESGEVLLTHINEILDVSRLEAGKLQLQMTTASVQKICNTSLALIRPQAQKKSIEITYLPDRRVNALQLDPLRFQQILVNLLSNAVKFTPIGGKVGLKIEGDMEKRIVHFIIADTGIGIAPNDLNLLFKPFSQLDGNLNRTHGGTGLGLVLVQRLAKLHNGSVSVKSQLGKGSSFTVTIPWAGSTNELRTDELPGRIEPASQTELDTSLIKILLCEDNIANADIICRYLRAQGYVIHHAVNGQQGIDMALQINPQIILMDIQMPGMDGLDATRHLRKHESTKRTPIIAITGLAMPQDYQRCIDAGVDNYMSKPIKLASLDQLIRTEAARFLKQANPTPKV